jgi:hypothetical protein
VPSLLCVPTFSLVPSDAFVVFRFLIDKLTSGQHSDPHILSDNGNAFIGDHYNRSLHEVVGFYVRLEVSALRQVANFNPQKLYHHHDISRSFTCTRMSLLR